MARRASSKKLKAYKKQLTQSGGRSDVLTDNPQRLMVVLITVAACLFFTHYLKYFTVYDAVLRFFSSTFYGDLQWFNLWRKSLFYDLYAQGWWTFIHLIGYVVIPLIIIKGCFKERLALYGVQRGDTYRYRLHYLALAAPIVVFAFFASFRADFSHTYPFYSLASRSYFDLLVWECLYIMQFVALEFFFRGFFLHSLQPALGFNRIAVMSIPYLLIHFPKPWLEAFGALPFGLLLGWLALRSRSMWGGVAVHVTIALSMDFFAIWRSGHLPTQWWPG